MAQTFFPITPVEVTPGTAGSWRDVNVSSYVPSGATGVILHIVNTYAGYLAIGLRKNGSTDNRYQDAGYAAHFWAAIGVDTNRVFEAYVESTTSIDIYLVGYTTSGVTFRTNAADKSLTTTGSWQDINCSTEAPNAIGLIWEVVSTAYDFGLRKNGSTDNRVGAAIYHACFGVVIGCDTSQICEGYIANTAVDFFLVGYITDGGTFNTNATDVSLTTTGAWTDLSALPSGANMGFIEVIHTGFDYDYGLRKNGSSEDIYRSAAKHPWGIVECDSGRIIEGKIEDTAVDFFVVGYSTAVTITEKSSADTGSGSDIKASANPKASLAKSDSDGGVEALLSRGLGAAEVGAGTEVYTLLVALVATAETGSGAESASKAFSSADSASGVESLVARLLAASETGTGTETLLSRLLGHTDSGLGADATLTLLATLAGAETASGIDASVNLITTALASSDTGSGIDKLLGRAISLLDAGSGLDVATLRKVLLSTDSGVGLEALADLLALIITAEAGSASEQLKAKIMTPAGAADMKLPTKMGKARISFKGVNQ